jgi:hypothetical protein
VTSRRAHVYGYAFTDAGPHSGAGQYTPFVLPLIGTNFPVVVPPPAAGRRVMLAFSAAEIGAAGTVTGVAWGPELNATWAATYPNVKLRMGYQVDDSLNLRGTFSGNYASAPTLIYDGPYLVQQRANVGNTPNQPTMAHRGPYPGCANGNFNLPLFQYTGWVDWPVPTARFEWDPGAGLDRVLLFDASVDAGTDWQTVRGWAGLTFPCSAVWDASVPSRRLFGTYESDAPIAGAVNPDAVVHDTSFTITRDQTIAQSLFYTPAGSAQVAAGGETYGADSDYGDAVVDPFLPSGQGMALIEFQGATNVLSDRRTIDLAEPHTPWTSDIDDCDGYGFLRWRIRLRGDMGTLVTPRVFSVMIPVESR